MLHCFSVPALGIKTDATPGRINRINAFIQRQGVCHSQCSELCGTLHGFMPIVVEAVSPGTLVAFISRELCQESQNGPQSLV